MRDGMFTIGHSNRSGPEFLSMLKEHGVTRLVDVRKIPRSRFNPQFNDKTLAKELAANGIAYAWMPELGGKRPSSPGSRNTWFRAEGGLQSYADYMATPEFHDAIDHLMAMDGATAIMCAEAKPEHCHRQLVADALLQKGQRVVHILKGDVQEHVMHPAAQVDANGQLYYPAQTPKQMALI